MKEMLDRLQDLHEAVARDVWPRGGTLTCDTVRQAIGRERR